jgi:hypothetical protein
VINETAKFQLWVWGNVFAVIPIGYFWSWNVAGLWILTFTAISILWMVLDKSDHR